MIVSGKWFLVLKLFLNGVFFKEPGIVNVVNSWRVRCLGFLKISSSFGQILHSWKRHLKLTPVKLNLNWIFKFKLLFAAFLAHISFSFIAIYNSASIDIKMPFKSSYDIFTISSNFYSILFHAYLWSNLNKPLIL